MANFPWCPWIHGIEAKHMERKASSVSPSAAAPEQHRQRGPSKPHGSATAFPTFKGPCVPIPEEDLASGTGREGHESGAELRRISVTALGSTEAAQTQFPEPERCQAQPVGPIPASLPPGHSQEEPECHWNLLHSAKSGVRPGQSRGRGCGTVCAVCKVGRGEKHLDAAQWDHKTSLPQHPGRVYIGQFIP